MRGQVHLPVEAAPLEAGELPDSWQTVPLAAAVLADVAKVGKVKQEQYRRTGQFAVIDQGRQLIAGYWDDAGDVYSGELPVIVFGDHSRIVKFVDFPFVAGADGTKILMPNRSLFVPLFLYYAVSSLHIPSRGYNRHFALLRERLIPRPPLSEQRAIASGLLIVQRAREATEAVIAATRELKKSLMRHLFTYGPVPILAAERVPLKETEFGSVPEHWAIAPLEQLALVQTGVAKGRRLDASSTVTLPYLRVANVQDGYLDLSEMKTIEIEARELSRYRLQPDDVVLTEGGDLDKLGRGFVWRGQIETCVHQNHVFAVRVDRQRLLPDYVAYLAQSAYGKSYFLTVAHRTTHLACINSAKLKALPVPVPPLEDQEDIVGVLQAMDRKLRVEESRKQALEALFASLLHNLMTGKVRVGDLEYEDLEHE